MSKRPPSCITTISIIDKVPPGHPSAESACASTPAKKLKSKQQTLSFSGARPRDKRDGDQVEATCSISLPAETEVAPDPTVRNPWAWTEPRYAYLGALPVKSADPRNRPVRYECKACQRHVTAYLSSTDSLKKHQTKVHRLPGHIWDALRKPSSQQSSASEKPPSLETDSPSITQPQRRESSDKVSVASSSRLSSANSRAHGPLDNYILGAPSSQEANKLFFNFMVSQLLPFRCLESESLATFFNYAMPGCTLWSRKQAATHLSIKAKSEIDRLTTHLSTLEWVSLTADIWSGPNCR